MDYQLLAAVGTTDADGMTTFTNRPPGAALYCLDEHGGWVPVPEVSVAVGGVPTTGYTDAQLDAFLAGKAPLNLPQLAPFVGYVNGALVGFETFEQACDARPAVLHVRTPTVALTATNRTFSGVLFANEAEFTVPDGVELRFSRSSQVYNATVTTPGTGVVAILGAGIPAGATGLPAPAECFQLIDCRVESIRLAVSSWQGLVLRGNTSVGVANTDAVVPASVPVYLYDYSQLDTLYASYANVDYRDKPGFAVLSGTVLSLTREADYGIIASGTFTVDTTGAQAGVVVRVELAAGASAPATLPARFELIHGTFQAGKRNGYGFSVMATGKIEYFIYPKP